VSLDLNVAQESLKNQKMNRYVSCWKLERTDGVIFYFTDHDSPLVVLGDTYVPVGSFISSATEQQANLEAANMQVVGYIKASVITDDDLRAGLYREAEITEYMIDWQYPWVGPMMTTRYWITDTTFSGEHWEATLEGVTRWLVPRAGDLYSRVCRWDLFDDRCQIVKATYKVSDDIDSIGTQRRIFRTTFTLAGGTALSDYQTGHVEWTAGNNDGLLDQIHDMVLVGGSTYDVTLQLPSAFDMQVGDTFDIYPGCDKLKGTCIDTYNNIVNYGGFPSVPGTDRMMRTVNAK